MHLYEYVYIATEIMGVIFCFSFLPFWFSFTSRIALVLCWFFMATRICACPQWTKSCYEVKCDGTVVVMVEDRLLFVTSSIALVLCWFSEAMRICPCPQWTKSCHEAKWCDGPVVVVVVAALQCVPNSGMLGLQSRANLLLWQ